MRKQLYKQGFDLKKVNLNHLSDKRLREFAATLDDNKKRIFIKAPQVATHSAAKLLADCHRPQTCAPPLVFLLCNASHLTACSDTCISPTARERAPPKAHARDLQPAYRRARSPGRLL